jgi:hypothetical protein
MIIILQSIVKFFRCTGKDVDRTLPSVSNFQYMGKAGPVSAHPKLPFECEIAALHEKLIKPPFGSNIRQYPDGRVPAEVQTIR